MAVREAAFALLGRRDCSCAEMRKYLQKKGFSPDCVERIVAELTAYGYLDDERLAKRRAHDRLREKGRGRRAIAGELLRMGIDPSVVRWAIASIDPEEEAEAAWGFARRKWPKLSGEPVDKLRALSVMLQRRGFPLSAVRRALQRLAAEQDLPFA